MNECYGCDELRGQLAQVESDGQAMTERIADLERQLAEAKAECERLKAARFHADDCACDRCTPRSYCDGKRQGGSNGGTDV